MEVRDMSQTLKKMALSFGTLTLSLAIVPNPGTQAQQQIQQNTVKIDGSSTVYPITQAVAKAFQKTPEGKAVDVSVAFSGTRGGFKKFCSGEIDISDASRPILKSEMETCKKNQVAYIEIPVAFDALTIVVNPQNNWVDKLTLAELRKMWEPAAQSKIKTWQQVRSSWPNRPLKLFGPGSESGTFDYFTEAVMGKVDVSRTDYVGSENDEVIAKGVSSNANALGYFGYAYYVEHKDKLKAIPVDSGKGAILPSPEAAQKNQYQPLSRPLFIYVNSRSTQTKSDVREFTTFYLKNAEQIVKEVNYIPLHPESYHQAQVHFYQGKVGTVFGGQQQQNLTLRELLRKQAQY
jgi:phosphate transport system substrate-binding protein